MYYSQYPEEFQELQAELMTGFHKDLIDEMNALGFGPDQNGISNAIVHIATHCGVLVEGLYTYQDKLKLCRRLAVELKEKRKDPKSPIILLS